MKCDTINRNVLSLKLFKLGINGKFVYIIKDIYRKVKSCVRSCNSYSEYFEYAIGLRQGEIMSPVVFPLHIFFNEYGISVIFKQRVIDCFKQDWHSSIYNNSVLLYLKKIKPDFSYVPYLELVNFPTRK